MRATSNSMFSTTTLGVLWAGLAAMWLPTLSTQAATRYNAEPTGSEMRVEGKSTLHGWMVKSAIISGWLELGFDPAKAEPGKVEAKAEAAVPVQTLKSQITAGASTMDGVMYKAMEATKYRRVEFRLKELVLKEKPTAPDAPLKFDSKGDLVIHGVTNTVSMPVTMKFSGDKLKTSGTVSMKMTEYKIEPPSFGVIKSADELTLTFDWQLAKAAAP